MKAALLMTVIALAALAVAYFQYQEAASLRGSLARSEEARLALQAQVDANTSQQASVQQQIQQLQDNLRSSSQQLLQLSNSLQEAREMLVPPTPTPAPAP
jgi:cell division protein FtsX